MPTPSLTHLSQVLVHWSSVQPQAPLLLAPETQAQINYGELAAFTQRLEAYYEHRGVARGDHVALFMPNGLGCLAIFLATLCCGRVIAPLNLLAHRSQLSYVLDHCDAKLVFTNAELASKCHEAGQAITRKLEIGV